jgi:hypothetical protein
MKFSYENLKMISKNGSQVGNWNGSKVFACSCKELESKGSGVFYILYDDDNTLVKKTQDAWMVYGSVNEAGNVRELDRPVRYSPYYYAEVAKAQSPQEVPAAPEVDEVEKDFLLNQSVEDVLTAARNATIDDLLDGFDYGLEIEAKG